MKSQGLRPRTLTQIEQRNRGCGSSLSPRRFSGQSRGARLGASAWPCVGAGRGAQHRAQRADCAAGSLPLRAAGVASPPARPACSDIRSSRCVRGLRC